MNKSFTFFTICLLLNTISVNAQLFYRIEADFSIKEKSNTGYENLILGKVYYDKNNRKIVFNIQFPSKEILIINDSTTIKTSTGEIKKHKLNENLIDFSVLHLFLNGDLEYFGLSKTPFKLAEVDKDQDLVISTWTIQDKYAASKVSKLLLSQKDNKLHGLITFGPEETILSKQIFSDYIEIQGLSFPSSVLQISYLPDGSEITKITEYKNVDLNNTTHQLFYNYKYEVGP